MHGVPVCVCVHGVPVCACAWCASVCVCMVCQCAYMCVDSCSTAGMREWEGPGFSHVDAIRGVV